MDLQFVSCISLKRASSPVSFIALRAFTFLACFVMADRPYSIHHLSGPGGRSSTDGFREDRCSSLSL